MEVDIWSQEDRKHETKNGRPSVTIVIFYGNSLGFYIV